MAKITKHIVIAKNERDEVVFLVAPSGTFLKVEDEIVYQSITGAAIKAHVIFESDYTPEDTNLYIALSLAFQYAPRKIIERVTHERIKWEADDDVDG